MMAQVPQNTCPTVTNLTVEGTTTSGAIIRWSYEEGNAIYAPIGYVIDYFRVDSDSSLVTVNTTNPYLFLTGLDPATEYKMYVRSDCGGVLGTPDSVTFSTIGFVCIEFDSTMAFSDTIGQSAITSTYLPSYSYYNYGYSQQIFTAAELGHGGYIDHVSIMTSSVTNQRNYEIYMGHITESSASVFLNPDDLTLVYNGGPISMTENQWTSFELTNPFYYNGSYNLLLVFRDMTGGYQSGNSFYVHDAPLGTSRYAYRDSSPYTLGNVSGGTTSSVRNNIIFAGAPCTSIATCSAPFVVMSGHDSSSVTIDWIPGAIESSWDIDYRLVGAANWTTISTGVTATTYTINNLMPSSDYEVRVVTICAEGDYAGTISFSTECGSAPLPIIENFQNSPYSVFERNCWLIGTTHLGTSFPEPYVVSIQGNESNKYCLFHDGGYMVLPKTAVSLNQLQVSFTIVQEDAGNRFLMGLLPNQDDPITDIVVLDTIIRSELDATSNTATYNYMLANLDQQYNDYNIVFWDAFNDDHFTYIDNLVVEYLPTCIPVTDVAASNITTNSADITWTGSLSSPESYVVEYGLHNFTPGTGMTMSTSTTDVSLTGLTDGTTYDVYVYAICSSSDISAASPVIQFSTECDVVNTLPYFMDFENIMSTGSTATDIMPNCWTFEVSNGISHFSPHIINSSSSSHSPSHCIIFYDTCIVALPAFAAPLNTLMVSFYDYNIPGDGMIIGAVDNTEPGFGSTFTPIDTIVYTDGIDGRYHITSYLSAYNGTATHIAFKNYSATGSTYSVHAIDDVVVDLITGCTPVRNLHVASSTTNSVTLDWGSYNTTDNNWTVSYSTTPLTDPMMGTTNVVTTHPYTITGLTQGVTYYFYVRNNCGSDNSSIWKMVNPLIPGTWIMRPNQTDTLHLCGGVLYDDAGADIGYADNQDSYIIIYPDAPQNIVCISGIVATELCCDYITIYDGVGTNGTVLFHGSGYVNDARSTNGPLTIHFHTDGYINSYQGFELQISCINTSCYVTNLDIDSNAANNATSLSLTWDNLYADKYQIVFGAPGFDIDNSNNIFYETTVNNYTITGLTSMVNYEVYVRAICSNADTGSWSHRVFHTPMCDNIVISENWDSLMTSSTSIYAPMGYSLYGYNYVQTIVDSAFLADITGDISAMAFHPSTGNKGDYFKHMTVYLANVSESDLTSGFIHPDESNHVFIPVITDRDMRYNNDDWQFHGFDTVFRWDGHSNILVSVKRDHGMHSPGATFSVHNTSSAKTRYAGYDGLPYDPTTISGGTALYVSGDIHFYSCQADCVRPRSLSVIDVTHNSATISWNSNANNFEVAIKAANEATWPVEVTGCNETSHTFSSLQPTTKYYYRVRAICDSTENLISDWVEGSFTTDSLPCFNPTDLSVLATSYTTVKLGWTSYGIDTNWRIHVWNTVLDTTYEVTSNPSTIGGLKSDVDYSADVVTICGGIIESGVSNSVNFHTSRCDAPMDVNTSDITAHTAVVSWNSSAPSYHIEYGIRGFSTGTGTSITATGNNVTLTDLLEDQAYDVYVYAICAEGIMSIASQKHTFETTQENINITGDVSLRIYPNPTINATTSTLKGFSGEVTVTVVDMNGRVVKSETMWCNDDCTLHIDVKNLALGTYFIRFSCENLNIVRKLIVK